MNRILSSALATACAAPLLAPVVAAQSGFTVTGPGCPGNSGVPTLTASSPFIGNSFDIVVEQCDPTTVGTLLMLGATNPMLDLASIGAPGCMAQTDVLQILRMNGDGARAELSFPLPNDPMLVGASIEAQGWCFVPGLNPANMALTNGGRITVLDAPIVFTAEGANSFNADTSSGFFRVENTTQLSIQSMTWDWTTSSNVGNQSQQFDVDQTGMADRPDGGNSILGGCNGTYRNGSDIATGLVYAGTAVSGCDGTANTGWIGSNQAGAGAIFRTLDFTFTSFGPGTVFEMDMDTDGGIGVSAGDMDGLVITLVLSDGSVRTGELRTVNGNLSRVEL